MKMLRYLCILAAILIAFTMLQSAAVAQVVDKATDQVVFSTEKVPDVRPPVYNILVSINESVPKAIISVEKYGGYSAEKRATTIRQRLEDAWKVLPDRFQLAEVLDVLKNSTYKVWVIAPKDKSPAGLPSHIMQADPAIAQSLGETEVRALRLILSGLKDDLKGIDQATRAPQDKTLDSQKQVSIQKYSDAAKETGIEAADYLNESLIANPENPLPYKRLIEIYKETDAAKSASVKDALDRMVEASDFRRKGDDSWDVGRYQSALEYYISAANRFPACVTYYWLQSLVYEKQGKNADAAKVLQDALKTLPSKSIYSGLSTSIGVSGWQGMIEARVKLLSK